MDIKIWNTLTRRKEVFEPIHPGQVGMYHCGPTVYDDAHIGNLRAYVFADILRRVFEYNKYAVHQVINITDVGHLISDADDGEDKMTKTLKRLGKPLTLAAMAEVADIYFERFVTDLERLNIEKPQELPKASRHIDDDIALIKLIEENGFTYQTSRGICFDVSKFPAYGKLANLKLDELKAGARVALDPEKKSPADFWLWKFDPKLGWDSPWGKGFPGWHIECSAMSVKYLGQPFDIHTGGIDHIPVHHTNEIAQSEAACGRPLADYWMHSAFITLNHDKMSKSSGNFLTLQQLIDQAVSPLAYRYWLLTAHYRSPIDFNLEAIKAAQNALIRLMTIVSTYPDGGEADSSYLTRFQTLINDDLDMPQAVALAWALIKDSGVSEAAKKATPATE